MNNKNIYAVYGSSGCGRSLMPVARQHLQRSGMSAELYFIDDSLAEAQMINGHVALNYQAFKALNYLHKHVLIAIANSNVREMIANRLVEDEIHL